MLDKFFKKRASMTAVVFRKSMDDGEIIALFPEKQWGKDGKITSYSMNGQYSGVGPFTLLSTKPAEEKEYSALQGELESVGYVLNVESRA